MLLQTPRAATEQLGRETTAGIQTPRMWLVAVAADLVQWALIHKPGLKRAETAG
jgi:hypothetical protein